jgi:cytochrome c553
MVFTIGYTLECAVSLHRNPGHEPLVLERSDRGVDMTYLLRACFIVLALSAASIFAASPPAPAKPAADPAKAQPIASSVCAACHGSDGNSPIPANPNLAGQHPEYLYKQLADYKAGRRKNPIMMGIVANLSDEDMRNLAAYFSQQKPRTGTARNRDLAAAGQHLYRAGDSKNGVPACAACHSPDGAGIPMQYPRLSGQSNDYTLAQLQLFRSGERANDPNSVMRTIAQRMNDKAIAAVSQYIAGLK